METHGILPKSVASFKMIDIAEKADTLRRAVASGFFYAKPDTISRIRNRTLPKGDVLVLAEVAGIQGAKRTADLLPLCHPLTLTSVRVWSEIGEDFVAVFCEVKTVGKTGVEMEALCGVNAALLCIYDLTKGIDPVLRLGTIQLEVKEGGKSGLWTHPGSARSVELISHADSKTNLLEKITAHVLTLSDRCSKGEAKDESGPVAVRWLQSCGAQVKNAEILPDDAYLLRKKIFELLDSKPDLILTTGGTGLSHRDITPETVMSVAKELGGREIPGIGELLRKSGAQFTNASWLSRSLAVYMRNTLVICLPGSPKAVSEGLGSVGRLIRHCISIASGGGHS